MPQFAGKAASGGSHPSFHSIIVLSVNSPFLRFFSYSCAQISTVASACCGTAAAVQSTSDTPCQAHSRVTSCSQAGKRRGKNMRAGVATHRVAHSGQHILRPQKFRVVQLLLPAAAKCLTKLRSGTSAQCMLLDMLLCRQHAADVKQLPLPDPPGGCLAALTAHTKPPSCGQRRMAAA